MARAWAHLMLLDPALQRPPCQSGGGREKPRRTVPGPSGRGRSVVGGYSKRPESYVGAMISRGCPLGRALRRPGVTRVGPAAAPWGGSISPVLALIALHRMDEAITQVYPQACVVMYADDAVVLHADRQVLEHCQQLLMKWLADIGLTLNEAKSHIDHTLEGDQPGFDWLGCNIRQYWVGKHQSGKRSNGQRLGFKTLIKPAKANRAVHLAELGRIIERGKVLSQGALIQQLNPKIRGWANYYRPCVSQAAFDRLDFLTLGKAAPLGIPTTSKAIRRLGMEAVLASTGQPGGFCHLGH